MRKHDICKHVLTTRILVVLVVDFVNTIQAHGGCYPCREVTRAVDPNVPVTPGSSFFSALGDERSRYPFVAVQGIDDQVLNLENDAFVTEVPLTVGRHGRDKLPEFQQSSLPFRFDLLEQRLSPARSDDGRPDPVDGDSYANTLQNTIYGTRGSPLRSIGH